MQPFIPSASLLLFIGRLLYARPVEDACRVVSAHAGRVFPLQGPVQRALQGTGHFPRPNSSMMRELFNHLHFTGKETEAQREKVAYPKSCSQSVIERRAAGQQQGSRARGFTLALLYLAAIVLFSPRTTS